MADRRTEVVEALRYHQKHIDDLRAELAKLDAILALEAEIRAKQAHLYKLKAQPTDVKDSKETKKEEFPTLSFCGHPPGCACSHCYEARTYPKDAIGSKNRNAVVTFHKEESSRLCNRISYHLFPCFYTMCTCRKCCRRQREAEQRARLRREARAWHQRIEEHMKRYTWSDDDD
jgi:hypothetical protein